MNGFFYTLLVTSVIGAVCTVMAWGGFEKYVRYIASLVCILLLLSPFRKIDETALADLRDGLTDSAISVGESELTIETLAEQKTEDCISELVFSEFGIKAVYTDIKIDWEEDSPVVESITVALNEYDMERAFLVRERLCRALGGEVTVVGVG
ncbi:MAG: hypothetical protein IKK70_03060 [Clostridia bacterium]|nr:hypothetical protein [Clostridia bacterium]